MKVELLFFDGCPSYERFLPQLKQLMSEAGIDADVELRRIESPEAAEEERFLGSPTLRINGQDIDPTVRDRTDYGLKCRLYRSTEGQSGTPPESWVRSAFERRERPDPVKR